MKITYTCQVWFNPQLDRLEDIQAGKAFPTLAIELPEDEGYFPRNGYCHIGTAAVEVTLKTDKEIVAGQVASLQVQLAAVRAENQQRENAILLRISKMQALTMNADLEEQDDGQPL